MDQQRPTFVHSFIPDISIAPLQVLYFSEVLNHSIVTVPESTRRNATGNCEGRTCPRSLCGEWDSNIHPFGRKALKLPLSHHSHLYPLSLLYLNSRLHCLSFS